MIYLGAGEGHQTIVSSHPLLFAYLHVYQQIRHPTVFPCPTMCATIRVDLWDQTWDGLGMGRLTDRSVKTVGEGRHGDGDGLQLIVSASGRRKWVLRYQLNGVRRDMGLGPHPAIGLSDARIAAADARKLIARGVDPLDDRKASRKAERPVPTFGDIAQTVIADAQSKSSNAKVRYQWERHLGLAYSGPLLARPVHEITTVEVASLLRPIWRTKPEVARKLYPAIRRVFEHARVLLRDEHAIHMPDNPARWSDLKAMGFETPMKLTRGSHPSLPYTLMAAFMADLRARDAIAARALEFLILTNVRTDAVLKAAWDQFDLDQALWTVPLANLKDRKHRKKAFRPSGCSGCRNRGANASGARVTFRLPGTGSRQAPIEHGAADASEANELWSGQEVDRPRERPAGYGTRISGHLQDLGRGGRDNPSRRD